MLYSDYGPHHVKRIVLTLDLDRNGRNTITKKKYPIDNDQLIHIESWAHIPGYLAVTLDVERLADDSQVYICRIRSCIQTMHGKFKSFEIKKAKKDVDYSWEIEVCLDLYHPSQGPPPSDYDKYTNMDNEVLQSEKLSLKKDESLKNGDLFDVKFSQDGIGTTSSKKRICFGVAISNDDKIAFDQHQET